MARILLLDGNSLLYRGFFAMRSLTTSTGQPTNALYSLTLMALTALDKFKPDDVVCAFDAPEATFRHVELESYKGHRQETPDELKLQAPIARDLVLAYGFQMLEIGGGFEADDVIGTLAQSAKGEGHEVFIITGDLDALQLVDDAQGPVRVVTTIKGLTETVVYDEAAVLGRYSLTPAQIPDLKGLKGDSSDNLPGIPGIGDKTASKLLMQYGTVENLFQSLPQMTDAKLQAKLAPYQDQALQCKRLATIIRDVPLGNFSFRCDYQERGADMEQLRTLFDQLEFRTLLKRFGGDAAAPTPSSPRQTQRNKEAPSLVQGQLMLDVAHPPAMATGVLLVTVEPYGKYDVMTATPRAIALASGDESGDRVVEFDVLSSSDKAALTTISVPKATYDLKLLTGTLARHDIDVDGVTFDALIAAYLLNSARSGYPLLGIISDTLGEEIAEDDYASQAAALARLEPVMRARMRQDGVEHLHDEIELPLSRVIASLEREGVKVDTEFLGTLALEMDAALKELENEVYNLAGGAFAIGSTKQLQSVLFEKLSLPPGKKTKTGYSTDAEVLEGLAEQGFEIAAKILQWREVNKLKSTYVDSLPTLVNSTDGRVHTTLSQTVASTGRLSSSNPNLQNIPVRTQIGREIRKAFVAEEGCVLVAADYSQIELRIFAHITRDPELVRTFEADEDIHRRTAALIFGGSETEITAEQRRRAKTINFAVIYGMGAFRLAVELGVTQQIAAEWRKRYFENYPGVRMFTEETLAAARDKGYVQTLLGRRRYVPDITSRVFAFRQAAEREAVNMRVQGTAADIIKLAMLKVDKAISNGNLKGRMILQVHDELLFECPESEADAIACLAQEAMESAYSLDGIRLRADVKRGRNWSEMEEG